jgi:hypothetical protein
MINDRKEALAAHELARTRIANRKQLKFVPFEKSNMGTCVSLLLGWKHVKRISRLTSTIETDWMITRQRKEERINSQEILRQTPFYSE